MAFTAHTQLEELLVFLRSRHTEEERSRFGFRQISPEPPQLPDQKLSDPNSAIRFVSEMNNESPTSGIKIKTNRYKLRRKISCEEIDDRRSKGLCLFCDEPETLYHHLQHKGSGIMMVDCDEEITQQFHKHADVKFLVESEELMTTSSTHKEVTIQDVEMLSEAKPLSQENSTETKVLVHGNELYKEKTLIQHLQVATSVLEPSLTYCHESLEMYEASQSVLAMEDVFDQPQHKVFVDGVKTNKLYQKGASVHVYHNAHDVFDEMILSEYKMQKRKMMSLFPKSWMFKFKVAEDKLMVECRSKKHVQNCTTRKEHSRETEMIRLCTIGLRDSRCHRNLTGDSNRDLLLSKNLTGDSKRELLLSKDLTGDSNRDLPRPP
ncbi:unnamed protein product [Cochlearia groenlandica]